MRPKVEFFLPKTLFHYTIRQYANVVVNDLHDVTWMKCW